MKLEMKKACLAYGRRCGQTLNGKHGSFFNPRTPMTEHEMEKGLDLTGVPKQVQVVFQLNSCNAAR